MQKRIRIKNHKQEIQLITQRAIFLLVILGILLGLLIARLIFLQIYKHDLYVTLSTKNWLDLVPIEPTRGLIYDRNGVLLAENISVFSLDIVPYQVTDLNKTLNALAKIVALTDNDISQFRKQLKQYRRFDEIPLKLRLSEAEVARFAENQHRFPGVLIKARLMRHYPFAESFSHVLGYVGRINQQELNEIDSVNYSASHYIGKLGIEKYYEEELHGRVGYQQVENDATGKPIRILKEIKGVPGRNIYLTLDSGLQFVAEKALEDHRGAIVAIQPATGQVLAMVSKPGYDPNLFVTGIDRKTYHDLQSSEQRPLFNRALRGQYPFGSVIKPYYAIGALDAGVVTADAGINDPGWFKLRPNSHEFHDHKKNGHGWVDLYTAIRVSCDIYFYELGVKMGIRRLDDILTKFGFGEVTGIDLDDELAGVVASPEWKRKVKGAHWYEGDTVISSIGQGSMQTTPLQLASATATLANHGQRFIPYLLYGEQMPSHQFVLQQPIPRESITLHNDEYWDMVIEAMQDVTSDPQGTAYASFGKNVKYTTAAKTATVQVVLKRMKADERDNQDLLPEKLRDHNHFIIFAPVENPKIALAVVTENSHVAARVARTVLDYYLGGKNANSANTKSSH